ncbi:MAG: YebC/PmpR family DNA-binding transcriptional regulator [Phycisphaeraceae bacterium]|nr:YebC/PmpR family DNA-binding transcriptional regulator [Phycisphaeraceae bacterium]
MAGHNKWSKIKHRKAVVDKRRGKVWTKISKAIIVAAKNGGPDPDANLSLRYAIDEARYANMPRDTIERAIKKGAGGDDTSNYESIRYECYAPGGVAIIVDALTDNRTRTINDLRLAFSNHGGNVGSSGCVAYLFQHRGQIVVSGKGLTEDRVMESAIDAGALDVESMGEDDGAPSWMVSTDPTAFMQVRAALEHAGLPIASAELSMVPESLVAVSGEHAQQVIDLIDAVEELDDVQKVYTNADLPG